MGSGFSMNSLQLCDDANMLLVGTQTGDVSLLLHILRLASIQYCELPMAYIT